MHFSFVKIINTRAINFELILNLSEFLNKYIIYTPSSLIKRYIHTNIHTYVHRSSPCCFPINVYPFQSLSRLMRGFIVRSCIRNLLDDRISSMRHSRVYRKPTRPIDRSRKISRRRESPLSRIYTRQIEGNGESRSRDDLSNFRVEMEQLFWKRDAILAFNGGGRDDRKRGGRIYEGTGGRMRASTSWRRRMLINEGNPSRHSCSLVLIENCSVWNLWWKCILKNEWNLDWYSLYNEGKNSIFNLKGFFFEIIGFVFK